MANVVTTVVIGDYRYTLYDDQTAWAQVTDRSKASYGALQASVAHGGVTYHLTSLRLCFSSCESLTTSPAIPSGVTNMSYCFDGYSSLTTAPSIPSGVTNMSYCFYDCTSLTTAPSIPSGVTNMQGCFCNCTSLTTGPSIPSGVTNIRSCFQNCTSLTGTIAVHGTPTYYDSCFHNTTLPIVLNVSNPAERAAWLQVAATGNNGNVSVIGGDNPAPAATITAVRVASSGSTTPDETGQYAYVTVRTTASTEQAPDNVAQAPAITLDGETYTPADPSGTATFTCHVSLGNDLGHVIGATPRDTYKTGTEVTVTLASTYSPMEFHATPVYDEHGTLKGYIGGDGASFGKHATRAGVLDVAWPIESEGEVSCGVSGGVPAHTLSSKVTVDDVYPIGSVYMNVSSTDPSTLFPGTTWRALAPGRVLVGAGTTTDSRGESKTFSNGASGGEFSHLLSGQESGVKGHTHKLDECRSNAEASGYGLTATSGFSDRVLVDTSVDARKRATETSGDIAATNAHNNIQPYLVVHMWERTA